MLSNINRRILLAAIGAMSFASAGAGGDGALNLSEFQRVLRTSLNSELAKIADGAQSQRSTQQTDQREMHTKRRSNMRRKATNADNFETPQSISNGPSFFEEHVWDDLVQFAWKTALAIKRDEERLSVTSDPEEAQPCPFLVCTRGRKPSNSHGEGGVQEIITLFDKRYEESLLLSSSHNETCVILTMPALHARQVTDSYDGSRSLVTVPLLDITKIHAGTIDEVSSRGWSVPFTDPSEHTPNSDAPSMKNETEAINQWERMIVVDFVPGLGGMKEESQLLEVVNNMMADIQDMGEVGWLRATGKAEAEKYLIEESLVGVPSLSDMFSLTSSLGNINNNARLAFWHDSLKNGIESEHACNEMFSTLFVKPRPGYYSYDLVMNPSDGPPPRDYESSASNPACVTSLIAAISTHPYVLSVKANFPIYHGWHVAQKLDSA